MTFSANRARISVLALACGGLAYPFAVYFALGRVPAGALALTAVTLAGGRIALMRGSAAARPLLPALLVAALAIAVLAALDPRAAALAYPVAMSLGMAASFGLSLWRGPSLVQILASMAEPDPSPAAQAYMRKVTLVWFVFLLGNAAIAAVTALLGDMGLWTLYNGLISYVLMGTLFAVEYAVRRMVRRREAAAP